MRDADEPIGVVLAGGLGSRMGGCKAVVELRGRPLISYPLATLAEHLSKVAVIAKRDTALPDLLGVELWIEPPEPRHPLIGIVQALIFAAGRPVLACAADLPFVSAQLIARLIDTDPLGAPAVVPMCDGAIQPLLALYLPAALAPLRRAAELPELPPLRAVVAAISPCLLATPDAAPFFNVNSRSDLLQAAALLDGGG